MRINGNSHTCPGYSLSICSGSSLLTIPLHMCYSHCDIFIRLIFDCYRLTFLQRIERRWWNWLTDKLHLLLGTSLLSLKFSYLLIGYSGSIIFLVVKGFLMSQIDCFKFYTSSHLFCPLLVGGYVGCRVQGSAADEATRPFHWISRF